MRSKISGLLPWIPVLILLGIRNYAFYWDGIDYAWQVENLPFSETFHQHHLIYTPFSKIIYLVLHKACPDVRSFGVMTGVNIVFGLIYLYLCREIIKRIFPNSHYLSLVGILLIAISYTFGAYWRNVDAYIIPLTIITLLVLRIMPKDSDDLKIGSCEWILLFVAILFHQVSALMLPALIFAQRRTSSQRRVLSPIVNSVLLVISLAGVYLTVFFFMSPHLTHRSFFEWVSGYAGDEYWSFAKFHGFPNVVFHSLKESILSHRYLFLPPVAKSIWWGEDTVDIDNIKIFLGLSWFLFVLFLFAIICGAKNLISNSRTRCLVWFFLVWIAPFFILFQLFAPEQSFYRMFYLLPLIIFILECVKSFIKTRLDEIAGLAILVVFMVINFAFGFIPESFPSRNAYLTYAKTVREQTTKRDLFVFSSFPDYKPLVYLRYFSDRDVFMIRIFPYWLNQEITTEELIKACGESREWLVQNYDNFYFSRGIEKYRKDFMKITPYTELQDIPDQLVLYLGQIHYLSVKELGGYPFNKIEISEYAKDESD